MYMPKCRIIGSSSNGPPAAVSNSRNVGCAYAFSASSSVILFHFSQAAVHWPGAATARDHDVAEVCARGGYGRQAPPGGGLVRRKPAPQGSTQRPCGCCGASWTPEDRETLIAALNMATMLSELRECAEAAVLLRTTIVARTRTHRTGDEGTLATQSQLVSVLGRLGEHAEAEALGRCALDKMRAFSVETTAGRTLRPATWRSRSQSKASTPKP